MNKEFTLQSDVEVFSVPDGVKTLLIKGTPGIITQSLGDNFTIVVERNMYQVKGIDAEDVFAYLSTVANTLSFETPSLTAVISIILLLA